MIGYISGTLLENTEGKVLVAVTQNERSKIGYTVLTPNSASYSGLHAGQFVEFFIHTSVREDALDLIGFLDRVEKEIFLTLLTVNGIGPKGALGILSKLEISTLIEAVLNESAAMLTDVPGIGKKTAERLIIELKDPIRKKVDAGMLKAPAGATGTASSKSAVSEKIALNLEVLKDAREALSSLGYREIEITAALKRVAESMKESGKSAQRSEEVIKMALKELA